MYAHLATVEYRNIVSTWEVFFLIEYDDLDIVSSRTCGNGTDEFTSSPPINNSLLGIYRMLHYFRTLLYFRREIFHRRYGIIFTKVFQFVHVSKPTEAILKTHDLPVLKQVFLHRRHIVKLACHVTDNIKYLQIC